MKKQIICHDVNNKKYEVATKKLTFRPSVYGIAIKNNKILLSKQWDGYDFPGGGLNLEETIEEALKREFWEETGYKIKVGEVIHTQTSFFHSAHSSIKEYWNCVLIYYTCKIISGKISTENFDEDEKKYLSAAEWVDIKNIKKLKFYNSVNSSEVIKKALK